MIAALILVPFVAGLLAFLPISRTLRRALLGVVAIVHLGLVALAAAVRPAAIANGWFGLDALGLVFLWLTSLLFLAAAVYAIGYLRREPHGPRPDFEEGALFTNSPEGRFLGCLLLFLSTMTAVCLSRHLGILWVGVEATTLASTPLIYFHRHHRSLEASWKYLLICSVGIGLALFGNLCLAVSMAGDAHSMLVDEVLAAASGFDPVWLRAAFVFLLVGYGTKMGLAPMHSWLPDAHSESPSVVSALLSGALLNTAFLAILRSYQVLIRAGQGAFGGDLLVGFGILSMAFGAVFILNQRDYKRMLAYSSVEHMGILALGAGVAGAAAYGAMLHAVNHSLTKGMLFLVAGNLLATYRTKTIADVRGAMRALPASGLLWMVGFLAITGFPPFGPFLSEFTILAGLLDQGRTVVATVYLALLAAVFAGMATAVLPMVQGDFSDPSSGTPQRGESPWVIGPPVVLAALVLVLGLYVPPALARTLAEAAASIGGP